jgi:hypothetical protein
VTSELRLMAAGVAEISCRALFRWRQVHSHPELGPA